MFVEICSVDVDGFQQTRAGQRTAWRQVLVREVKVVLLVADWRILAPKKNFFRVYGVCAGRCGVAVFGGGRCISQEAVGV